MDEEDEVEGRDNTYNNDIHILNENVKYLIIIPLRLPQHDHSPLRNKSGNIVRDSR